MLSHQGLGKNSGLVGPLVELCHHMGRGQYLDSHLGRPLEERSKDFGPSPLYANPCGCRATQKCADTPQHRLLRHWVSWLWSGRRGSRGSVKLRRASSSSVAMRSRSASSRETPCYWRLASGGCSNSQLQQAEHIHRSGRICANRGAFIFLSSAVVVEWFSVDNGK